MSFVAFGRPRGDYLAPKLFPVTSGTFREPGGGSFTAISADAKGNLTHDGNPYVHESTASYRQTTLQLGATRLLTHIEVEISGDDLVGDSGDATKGGVYVAVGGSASQYLLTLMKGTGRQVVLAKIGKEVSASSLVIWGPRGANYYLYRVAGVRLHAGRKR